MYFFMVSEAVMTTLIFETAYRIFLLVPRSSPKESLSIKGDFHFKRRKSKKMIARGYKFDFTIFDSY